MKTQRLKEMVLFSLVLAALALPGRLGAEVNLWPAFESTEDSTTVLYPFFVHEGDFMMVFPWYYRTNGGKDHHVLWPIAKTSEGRVARLAPFWFSGQDGAFTLFPLIRQTSDYTVWTVPPVYHRHDGSFQAVFPFYMRSPEKLYVFPTFYRSQSQSVTRTLLFPVYAAERGPRIDQVERA